MKWWGKQNYIHDHLKRINYLLHVTNIVGSNYIDCASILRAPWGVSQPSQKFTTATARSFSI
jgi:hypothetical protein